MRVGIDIDFTLTVFPEFFKNLMSKFRSIIVTSFIKEIGDREANFKYRVRQMRKLGIKGGDYEILAIAEGLNLKEVGKDKAIFCDLLGIDVMFDDQEIYVDQIKRVTDVVLVEGG